MQWNNAVMGTTDKNEIENIPVSLSFASPVDIDLAKGNTVDICPAAGHDRLLCDVRPALPVCSYM